MANGTHKSVSVRGSTYDALRERCDKYGVDVGPLVDRLCTDFLDRMAATPAKKGRRRG